MVKFFGKKSMVPHVTYTSGVLDPIPQFSWDKELWIERGEDWYALNSYKKTNKTVLIVRREDFLNGLVTYRL